MLEFASTEEGARFLERQHQALVAPRGTNDPEHVAEALARDVQREATAGAITVLHHILERGRSYGAITFANDKDHARARETMRILQGLLETELRYHEDKNEQGKSGVQGRRRPAKHEYGRVPRSLATGKGK